MPRKTIIKNGKLVFKYGIKEGDVIISDCQITEIGTGLMGKGAEVIDAKGLYVTPGFIDIHSHGRGGYDFMDGTVSGVKTILDTASAHGTTTMLGTVLTAPIPEMRAGMKAIIELNDPRIAGLYVEGPFFSHEKKGAQSSRHLLRPEINRYKQLTEGFTEKIKFFALAPELPGTKKLITRLLEDDIDLTLAHSNATYSQAMKAIELGLNHFTHFFNGMSGFHHRDPGAVGAALRAKAVNVELIADGIHVHPEAIKLLIEVKGVDNVCLITDAIRATGVEDGNYMLGDQEIIVKDGIARLVDGGSLAGSTLTMDKAVKNMVQWGVPLYEAVREATLIPAQILGLQDRKGQIIQGNDADLVLMNENLQVLSTLVGGKVVYKSANNSNLQSP